MSTEPSRLSPPSAPRRILIVDDNVDTAEALAESLKIYGHDVHIAHDGPSALERAGRLQLDVMILDIGMPAMDGYEVAKSVRSTVARMPVLIALTGYARECDRVSAREAGFDHHFAKPLDMKKLSEILAQGPAGNLIS